MRPQAISRLLGVSLCLVASAAFAQTTASNAAKFFVGKWYVADAKVCKGQLDGAQGLITYTDKKAFGYESRCDIVRATPQGNRFELQLKCRAEGETSMERETVELVQGKLKVTKTDGGKVFSFTYSRCP
jgi:hypothetical protein